MRAPSLGRATLGLLVLAVAVRVAAAAVLGNTLYFTDEADYVDAADRLLAGDGFAVNYTRVPAYPVLVAALRAVAPGDISLVRGLHGVLAASGVVLVVRLGARTLGRRAALIAGLLYAVDPMFAMAGGLLYPEPVAAVLLLGILLAALDAAHRDRTRSALLAGLGLGLLAQLRPVALVIVPPIAAWVAGTTRGGARRRCHHVGAVLLGGVLALAPWTYRSYRVHGAFVPIATAGTEAAPVEHARAEAHGLARSLVEEAWREPTAFLRHLTRELGHFFELYPQRLTTDNPEYRAELHGGDPRLPLDSAVPRHPRDVVSALTFGPELLLALVGLAAGWWDRRPAVLLLAAVTLCYGLGYALFVGKLRYRIPVLPLLFLLAGHGVVTISRRVRVGARPPA